MLTPPAHGLAILLNSMIILVGVRFLVVPHAAAAAYGVPAKEDGDAAYLSVKGVRDLSYGILGLALLAFSDAHAAAWFMLIVTIAPLSDTLGGTRAVAFGIHFATAVVMLIDTALLFAV